MFKPTVRSIGRLLGLIPYKLLDRFYVPLDRMNILRGRNIRLIPTEGNRRGGKYSYAEWAHVIGIFQTLIFVHLDKKENNRILDVGCGTGLLGIASEPFIGGDGRYMGIDVMKNDIDFCRLHYPSPAFEFIHLKVNNPAYAPSQETKRLPWPVGNSTFDLVTAVSVWTHFNEEDALFYIKEVNRVLKPGCRAIITLFYLDETYRGSLSMRSKNMGRYHRTSQQLWIFDQSAYGSDAWFCPKWTHVPENAIGITEQGINRLISVADLELIEQYQGNWKEVPGLFFQDIFILRKGKS